MPRTHSACAWMADDLRQLKLEEQLRLLWAYTRGLILEFDSECRYINVWTNEPSLLYRPPEELLGKTLQEVLGDTAAAPFVERTQRILRTGRSESWEYELEVQSGRRWFSCDAIVAPRPEQANATVAFLIRDVTDERLMRSKLEQA